MVDGPGAPKAQRNLPYLYAGEPETKRPELMPGGPLSVELTRPQVVSGTTALVQVFGRRHDGRRLTLRRPASKKRQGTKSREAGERLGSERYGDFRLAPRSPVGATLGRRGLHDCTQGGREREKDASAGA
jgi:hypothetical protein